MVRYYFQKHVIRSQFNFNFNDFRLLKSSCVAFAPYARSDNPPGC